MVSYYNEIRKTESTSAWYCRCAFVNIEKQEDDEMEDKRIRLNDQELVYKKGFKWNTIPYDEILQAYLRIEEVNGRLCCGVANFDMYFLVLKTRSDDLIKIEAESKDIVKEILEQLKQKNHEIEIGFKK